MKALLLRLVFSFLLILGPPLPKGLFSLSVLEMHGDVYVIGGWANSGAKSKIYRLSCLSGLCSWTTLKQKLKVGRSASVAIPVQDHFCIE